MRLLLEPCYEPRFSDRSYGFRPGRGCHTALRDVAETWTGTTWFIEADIADCFGSLDHQIMVDTVAENIRDKPAGRGHEDLHAEDARLYKQCLIETNSVW
jgi:retron-type reverse transcriptase